MSNIDWINDELTRVMIASREGWGIDKMGRGSCKIIKWNFDYHECKFEEAGSGFYYVHPMLRNHDKNDLIRDIKKNLSDFTFLNGITNFLAGKYQTPGHPIIVQEIKFKPRTKSDSVDFHPKDGYKHPDFQNHTPTWPNGNFSEIPYIYDATHFAKGFRLSKKGSSAEVIYDDIRFHQHGCTQGYKTERIDEIYTPGIGGQRGRIEEFIEVIEKTIEERGMNSRILIFEKDSVLKFNAWTSNADFEAEWKDFVKYLLFLYGDIRIESDDFEQTFVGEKLEGSIIASTPPNRLENAHFCCYMFTPVEQDSS